MTPDFQERLNWSEIPVQNKSDDLIDRLRTDTPNYKTDFEAADALEAKGRRIAELHKEVRIMDSEYKTATARITELEAALNNLIEAAEGLSEDNRMTRNERIKWLSELCKARKSLGGNHG